LREELARSRLATALAVHAELHAPQSSGAA
jgi:hypothetical protein